VPSNYDVYYIALALRARYAALSLSIR